MTPDEPQTRFNRLSEQLFIAQTELEALRAHVGHACDRRAIDYTATDLVWASVNCRVMAAHAVGDSMDDKMGFGGDHDTPHVRSCAACGRALSDR